jgi:hypothetical protein
MEERDQLLGLSVPAGDVRSFVKIASKTTQRQIASHRLTAVLFGDDVIDSETVERVIVLMDVAILAPIHGAFAHQLAKHLIHGPVSTWKAGREPSPSEWK